MTCQPITDRDPITQQDRTVGHICYGPPMVEVSRKPWKDRWCFACRGYHQFDYVITAPTEPSYYGPTPSIECSNCKAHNGDCGFGRWRGWEDWE